MWRNMMREYSEEFLGHPEYQDGDPIDYLNTEPFRSLDAARSAGRIRVHCLGVGLDALTFVGDVLTVAVFDADVFDEIFGGLVDSNDEGVITGDRPGSRRFTFDRATIDRLLAGGTMTSNSAACLLLAWRHRESLLS
jgi:hypothetical protein